MFKEFKDAPTMQLVAQSLPANELVLKFIDKNEAKVEEPAPSPRQPVSFQRGFSNPSRHPIMLLRAQGRGWTDTPQITPQKVASVSSSSPQGVQLSPEDMN